MTQQDLRLRNAGLFTTWNMLRPIWLRDGIADRGRINRALGVAQRKAPPPYGVTLEPARCTCPDNRKGRHICKHLLARAILEVGR